MSMPPIQIYCDESGFSGNNLLNAAQPYFVVGTVAVGADEAAEIVAKARTDFRLQGPELKGKKLLQHAGGRKAMASILKAVDGRAKAAIFEKRFALACKLFEYIFEPPLAKNSVVFYGLAFHRFIANLLYLHFTQNARYAEEIFDGFEKFMSQNFDEKKLAFLTSKLLPLERPPALELIAAFTLANIDSVRAEMASLQGDAEKVGKWVLDLTSTGVWAILCEWAETHDQLEVFCDDSAPIADNAALQTAMVGNTDRYYHTVMGDKRYFTFNLVKPIELVKSIETPGVQIADVVASATRAVVTNPRDTQLDLLKVGASRAFGKYPVIPDLDEVDLTSPSAERNYLLLQELVRRSLCGESLLDDIRQFVIDVSAKTGATLPGSRHPHFFSGGKFQSA